jgi:uncharacterized protein YndB with AHSA1/START domain
MVTVEESIIIQRPVEEVFAFVADQENGPRWQADLEIVRRVTDGPIGVGTRHTAVRHFGGDRLEVTNEYIRYEPGRLVIFTGESGPLTFEGSYRTEATAEGTRLTDRFTIEPNGLFPIDDPEMVAVIHQESAAALATLKALLEGRSTATSD